MVERSVKGLSSNELLGVVTHKIKRSSQASAIQFVELGFALAREGGWKHVAQIWVDEWIEYVEKQRDPGECSKSYKELTSHIPVRSK